MSDIVGMEEYGPFQNHALLISILQETCHQAYFCVAKALCTHQVHHPFISASMPGFELQAPTMSVNLHAWMTA
jgi:hypothetical protein